MWAKKQKGIIIAGFLFLALVLAYLMQVPLIAK